MYNRILKRPMFKRGGSSFQAQGTGITSPYDTPRKRYDDGTPYEDIYSDIRKATQDPRGDFSYAAQGFSSLANPYKESGEAKTIGEMLYAGARDVGVSREKASDLERSGELAVAESQAGRKLQEEKIGFEREKLAYEETRDLADRNLQRYLGEIEAKGKKQYIIEELDKHWDTRISAAQAEGKSEEDIAALKAQKAKERREVLRGYDVSDTMAILRNTAAFEKAEELARGELAATINPATTQYWLRTDKGFADAVIKLTQRYLRQIAAFLEEDEGIELDATGGRVGRALGGGMTEDVNVMTKTPGGISDINVSETVERDPGETNEINISYEQLRDRLPPEISDEIVLLLSESYEAFADFAELQTQADVNEFNTKYNVQLFLPQQSGA